MKNDAKMCKHMWLTARVGVSTCVSTLLLSHNEDGTESAPRRTGSPRQRRPADGHQMNKLWRGPRIVMGSNAPHPMLSPRSPSIAPRSPYTDSSISLQRPAFGPHSPRTNYEWKVISRLPRRALKQYFRADPHVKMLLETGGAEADSSHTDPGSAKYCR